MSEIIFVTRTREGAPPLLAITTPSTGSAPALILTHEGRFFWKQEEIVGEEHFRKVITDIAQHFNPCNEQKAKEVKNDK